MAETTERVFNFGTVDMQEGSRVDSTTVHLDEREFPLAECVESHQDHPFRPLLELGFEQVRVGGNITDGEVVHLRITASLSIRIAEADSEYQLEAHYDENGTRQLLLSGERTGPQSPSIPIDPAVWDALQELHDSLTASLVTPEVAAKAEHATAAVNGYAT
ncbi:MAG TPA: hypothetical protein VIF43_00645 [Patescibacteria group bacterium]|jgi:hypothetical protein